MGPPSRVAKPVRRDVSALGPHVFLVVEEDGTRHVVYVAGAASDQWAFADGRTFHDELTRDEQRATLALFRDPAGNIVGLSKGLHDHRAPTP